MVAEIFEVKEKGGLLEDKYFLNLLQFIGEKTRQRMRIEARDNNKLRRKYYTMNLWANYQVKVKEYLDIEDAVRKAILKKVLARLIIDENTFEATHDKLAHDDVTS